MIGLGDRHPRHPGRQVGVEARSPAGAGGVPTTVTPGWAVPPPYSSSSSTTRSAARLADRGVDAALVALAGLGGDPVTLAGAEHRDRSQWAASTRTVVVVAGDLGRLPAHHAAQADGAGVVGDDEVLG